MSSSPTESTPEPIKAAAATIGTVVASVVGLLGAAVSLGVISTQQADSLTAAGDELTSALPALAAAITVIIGVVSGVAASLATAWKARKDVVPTNSDVFAVVPADPAVGPPN